MAKSMTERIKDWRKKKSLDGGRSLTVMLEPESVKVLEGLKESYQESNAKVIARALAVLHKSFTYKQEDRSDSFTCNLSDSQIGGASYQNHPPHEESASNTDRSIYPLLRDIKEKLDQGATVMGLKEELIKAMKEMRTIGYDSSRIADQLFEARIKTSKGNDRWEGGTIRKWWK